MKSVTIGGKEIQNYGEPFIIADIASNHKGDINLAKILIDKAVECGCDSIKFQSWSKKSLYSKQIYEEKPEFEQEIDKFALAPNEFAELKNYADEKGIMISSTPSCKEDVDFLSDEMNVSYIKVASMDIINLPLLEHIAKKGKPIILSTGMADLAEIDVAVRLILKYHPNLILLHCMGLYPQKDEQSNLNNISMLMDNFDVPIGYSDHSLGIAIPLASVVKGVCLIEKHLSLDNKDKEIWDKNFSCNPAELKALVKGSKRIVKALGNYQITLDGDSLKQREVMRRSIVINKDLPVGHVLTYEDITFKRPGIGIEPKYLKFVMGRALKKDLHADNLVSMEDLV